jgi:hypothetical protein
MRKESKNSEKEINLGERKISKMNFSYIVTIPKRFIQSTRYEKITSVRLIMSDGCLKLVPVRAKNGDEEVDL